MKKTLVSALATALVVGAASTTFAAANPFSDVPADHWAYDAVTQLAADGVIEGYGDTSFKGDKNITRYEMAQMVAKAMAKSNVSGNDKALIDKLAAEFADELNNLGVRVSNLERNADMVKWNGVAEYTLKKVSVEHGNYDSDARTNNVLFRLEPSAEVNSNWHVKARLDANSNLKNDTGSSTGSNADGNSDVKLKRIWAQGDYSNFQVKVGKFAPIDNDSIFDTTFSGAEASFGKVAKLTLGAGRINDGLTLSATERANAIAHYPAIAVGLDDSAANYQYAGLGFSHGKLDAGVSYHHLNTSELKLLSWVNGYKNNGTSDEANIWKVTAGYTFSKNVALNGYYADNRDADNYNTAYATEVTYKGAQAENKGTWGAWVAYRHLGQNVDFFNTYDAIDAGNKGWEIGANYVPYKNILTILRYGKTKSLDNGGEKASVLFGRVDFFF